MSWGRKNASHGLVASAYTSGDATIAVAGLAMPASGVVFVAITDSYDVNVRTYLAGRKGTTWTASGGNTIVSLASGALDNMPDHDAPVGAFVDAIVCDEAVAQLIEDILDQAVTISGSVTAGHVALFGSSANQVVDGGPPASGGGPAWWTGTTDPNGYSPGDFTPTMTSDTTPAPLVAAASSDQGQGAYAYSPFTAEGQWVGVGGGVDWLSIYFGVVHPIDHFTVAGDANYPLRMPKDFTFEGSNDGSSWTVIATFVDQTGWGTAEVRSFSAISRGYLGYRWNITANNGDATHTVLRDIRMYTAPGQALAPFTGGATGDFYVDTVAQIIYGPKQASGLIWPVLLVVSQGQGSVANPGGPLTADLPVFGNGASNVKVGTKSGDTDELATVAAGTKTAGHLAAWDSGGNLADGGAPGAGGGGGGGGLVLLEQYTASGSADLFFTSFYSSSYDEYRIAVLGLLPTSNGAHVFLRCSTDGGSTYDTASNYGWASFRASRAGYIQSGNFPDSSFELDCDGGQSNDPAKGGFGATITMQGPFSGCTRFLALCGMNDGTGNPDVIGMLNGRYVSSSPVNGLAFYVASGNFASGVIRIYGVPKS